MATNRRDAAYHCCWNCVHGLLGTCETPKETNLLATSRRICDARVEFSVAEKDPFQKRECSTFALNTGHCLYREDGITKKEANILSVIAPEARAEVIRQAKTERVQLSKPLSQFTFPLEESEEGRFVLGLMWICDKCILDQEELDLTKYIIPLRYENGRQEQLEPHHETATRVLEHGTPSDEGDPADQRTVFAIAKGKLDRKAMGRSNRPVECYLMFSNEDVRKANKAYVDAKASGCVRGRSGLPCLSDREKAELTDMDYFAYNQTLPGRRLTPTLMVADFFHGTWVRQELDSRLWTVDERIFPAFRKGGLEYFGRVKSIVSPNPLT